jgi:hypothetical protein
MNINRVVKVYSRKKIVLIEDISGFHLGSSNVLCNSKKSSEEKKEFFFIVPKKRRNQMIQREINMS